MILHTDEPGMVGKLDGLRQYAVRRHAGKAQSRILELALVVDVHLVAVAMVLADVAAAIDLRDAAFFIEHRIIGTQAHGAAEIAARLPLLERVAAHPLGHEADDWMIAETELG